METGCTHCNIVRCALLRSGLHWSGPRRRRLGTPHPEASEASETSDSRGLTATISPEGTMGVPRNGGRK